MLGYAQVHVVPNLEGEVIYAMVRPRDAYWRMLPTRKVAMNVLAHLYSLYDSRGRYLRAM